ncbi:MAG: glycoside hydrolase family 92 protein, partial [Bacteroidales bacterium]|nr:glycoside hydrolase family 92 protein [Bacteroidales bacterium]
MRKALLIALMAIIAGCATEVTDYTSYVDPFIGTGGHGHVFVGANVPFGAVQLGPTSVPVAWDWCSGYHSSDSSVVGFSHTHLSGTGIGDLFDITVLPVTAAVQDFSPAGIADVADRSREVCVPGYYSVPLKKSGVLAELTATERVGYHRYTFPAASADAALVFDLENGGCWDAVTSAGLSVIDNTHIEGYRFSKGWADDQKIWFHAEFSSPFESCTEAADHHWLLKFPNAGSVEVKVAISPVSCEGAAANMSAELSGWDFEATRKSAREAWNKELGKVEIKTSDETARKVFYTALYHSMTAPSLFCDNGSP